MTIYELNRRGFIGVASIGAAVVAHAHGAAAAQTSWEALPAGGLDWPTVAKLFAFPSGYIALNAANLCPASKPVSAAERDISFAIDEDPSFENRLKFEERKESVRADLAAMAGCDPDEIAITRNTSEGNCTVVAGLDLGPGDDVLLWDQNHESNLLSWQEASKRRGFKIVLVSTPEAPKNSNALLAPFAAAMTSRTRVLAFSHVSNMTGVKLPAEDLCAHARRIGALSLVDGAQTFAVLPIDLTAMGCDFYTASMHKWFAGPRECGLLYVRRARFDTLWPAIIGHGWDDKRKTTARKFDCLGQQEDGRILAIGKAVEIHRAIGSQRMYARIMQLNAYLRSRLASEIESCEFVTPVAPDLNAGITVFRIGRSETDMIRQKLFEVYHISALCVPAGSTKTLIRFCPHIYNDEAQLDRAVAALAAIIA